MATIIDEIIMENLKAPWEKAPNHRYLVALEYLSDPYKDNWWLMQDPYIASLTQVLRAKRSATDGYSHIITMNKEAHAAWNIFISGGPYLKQRWIVEGLIMNGATDEEMYQHIRPKEGPDVFHWYRKLFFDVTDYLHQRYEIAGNVFALCYARSNSASSNDFVVKYAAYTLSTEEFHVFMARWAPYKGFAGLPSGIKRKLNEIRNHFVFIESLHIANDMSRINERMLGIMAIAAQSMEIAPETITELEKEAFGSSAQDIISRINMVLMTSKDKILTNGVEFVAPRHHLNSGVELATQKQLNPPKELTDSFQVRTVEE